MPQQINLCTSVLASAKQHFPARTMLLALGILLVAVGATAAAWIWNVQRNGAILEATLVTQTKEIAGLKVAIQASHDSAAPVDQALLQQLDTKRATLEKRQRLLEALQNGVLMPGMGHSDRLQLLANSIPDSVWVTQVQATAASFRVGGFTLEPAALNGWVGKLSASPLMRGLKLSTVQVENTLLDAAKKPAKAASEPAASTKPTWAFDLLSTAVAPAPAASAPVTGAKP